MKTAFPIVLLLLALIAAPGQAPGQGTAIRYQGRLTDGAVAATGLYDVQLTVYDGNSGGTAVAGPITTNAVSVTNGLFVVTPDFGPNVFNGASRWIEIAFRRNGTGAFSSLPERQAILATPYAILAGSAANVGNNTITPAQIHVAGGAPSAGQLLGFDGANFLWRDLPAGGTGAFSLNGTSAYYNGGNVGIGTAVPAAKLDVRGAMLLDTGNDAAIYTGTGAAELNRYLSLFNSPGFSSASGLRAGGVLIADNYFYGNPGKNDLVIKGSVAIGTATATSRLTLRTGNSSLSGWGLEHTDGNVRLSTFLDGASGWLGTRSNHPLNFFVNDGLPSMTIQASGQIDYTRLAKLDVADNFSAVVRAGDFLFGHSTRRGTPGRALVDFGNELHLNFAGDWATTVIGGATTSVQTLTIRGGADLAEPFEMQDEITKGAVVVIDDEHPGKLALSTRSYDTRVAGVVSGANGIHPGIALRQEGMLDRGENVALSGRVFVQADASHGVIKPGDLLTTSDTPGHAMKVTDPARAQGAILGKAMSGLKEGKGLVLVLVTLQ